MSWYRKKGKYWYFVEKIDGKEHQHYIGDDKKVKENLCDDEKANKKGSKEKI